MKYLKVEGHGHLVRDPKTNSIINTNMLDHQEYVSRRNAKSEESRKIQNIEEEVASLKNDLTEIKDLLRSIANGSR